MLCNILCKHIYVYIHENLKYLKRSEVTSRLKCNSREWVTNEFGWKLKFYRVISLMVERISGKLNVKPSFNNRPGYT